MSGIPKRITLDLATFHQDGLAEIAEHLHLRNVQELLSVVISRGIVEILGSPSLPHTCKERSGGTRAKIAFPSRMNMMIDLHGREDWADLHAKDEEYDRESARMNRDLGLAETRDGTSPLGRQVNVGVTLPEGLREGLEAAVNAYPDLDEENLYCALLEIGLKNVREDPKALVATTVAQRAGTPPVSKEASRQQHRAAWKALCRNVARGWR